MSITPQVAPSEYIFNAPEVTTKKKFKNKEKDKQIAKRPFFGGFSKETKNMQSTNYKNEEAKVVVKAGGYNPESRKAQREKFDKNVQNADMIASGIQVGANQLEVEQRNIEMAHHENINKFLKIEPKKKKATPGGGGFKINIKKKKKRNDELKKLKNIDLDIHDRWIADPVVKEVIEKYENEIKKAGHQYNDKPIPVIIPKENIKKI
jgi:hypothetical protein